MHYNYLNFKDYMSLFVPRSRFSCTMCIIVFTDFNLDPSVLKPGVLVTKDSTTSSKGTQSPSRRLPGQTNRYNESQRSNAGPGKLDKRSSKSATPLKDSDVLKQKSLFSVLFSSCVEDKTPIHLTNLYARDIAEQYDLQPWHLRRMKRRFDDIDLDRSGNISAEEFLEATGSIRSPFTDKLFALMGKTFEDIDRLFIAFPCDLDNFNAYD